MGSESFESSGSSGSSGSSDGVELATSIEAMQPVGQSQLAMGVRDNDNLTAIDAMGL